MCGGRRTVCIGLKHVICVCVFTVCASHCLHCVISVPLTKSHISAQWLQACSVLSHCTNTLHTHSAAIRYLLQCVMTVYGTHISSKEGLFFYDLWIEIFLRSLFTVYSAKTVLNVKCMFTDHPFRHCGVIPQKF